MTLWEMAAEYRRNIEKMNERVKELRSTLPTLSAEDSLKMCRRILDLEYIMRDNMRDVLQMESYYKKEDKR